jgi:hypothetical protein
MTFGLSAFEIQVVKMLGEAPVSSETGLAWASRLFGIADSDYVIGECMPDIT